MLKKEDGREWPWKVIEETKTNLETLNTSQFNQELALDPGNCGQ